jgi:dienelactone hydrolase
MNRRKAKRKEHKAVASDSPATFTRRQALGLLGALALPLEGVLSEAAAAETPAPKPPSPLPPDLANLHETMAWIARENSPRLSFLDPQWHSLDLWKSVARPILRRHHSYDPTPVPLSAELVRREERDGFSIEVVKIRATANYDIPARVLVPAKRNGRLPAVVAMHCHSGRYTWGHEKVLSAPGEPAVLTEFRARDGRPWAEALVKRGYVVIVADAFYFGERRLRAEELEPSRVFPEVRDQHRAALAATPGSPEWVAAINRVCSFYENLTAKALSAAGATWPGLLAWDDMRTVDYLASRPDVDPARLGAAGLSGGGLRTAHLIAADPRIKAASVTGWMTEFAHQLHHHLRHTWMAFSPGMYSSLDLPDAAALHAPGALLVQQCLRDQLYPLEGMRGAVDKLTKIYAKAGIPEKFRGSFHDVVHSFPPALQDETFAWFDRWL